MPDPEPPKFNVAIKMRRLVDLHFIKQEKQATKAYWRLLRKIRSEARKGEFTYTVRVDHGHSDTIRKLAEADGFNLHRHGLEFTFSWKENR